MTAYEPNVSEEVEGGRLAEFADTPMSRRALLRRGALAGAGLVAGSSLAASAAGRASAAASDQVTIVFATYGGPYQDAQQKAWLDPFMKAYPNIKVEAAGPVDYGKIKAMVEAKNVTWDVVDVNGDFGGVQQKDLLTRIDCSVVQACKSVLPGLKNTPWRVGENMSALTIAYNTKVLNGKVPKGWADVFDTTNFPGKRMFPAWASGGVLEAALLADGVSPKHLYPLNLTRAFKKLDPIKGDIVWWGTATQAEQLIGGGEVSIGGLWGARIYDLVKNLHKPVGISWNQNLSFGSYLVVPKGTKHPKEAMLLVDWITRAKNNAKFSYYYPVGPAATGAVHKVDPKSRSWFASSHVVEGVPQSDAWWNANIEKVTEKFKAWQQA